MCGASTSENFVGLVFFTFLLFLRAFEECSLQDLVCIRSSNHGNLSCNECLTHFGSWGEKIRFFYFSPLESAFSLTVFSMALSRLEQREIGYTICTPTENSNWGGVGLGKLFSLTFLLFFLCMQDPVCSFVKSRKLFFSLHFPYPTSIFFSSPFRSGFFISPPRNRKRVVL